MVYQPEADCADKFYSPFLRILNGDDCEVNDNDDYEQCLLFLWHSLFCFLKIWRRMIVLSQMS